MVVDGRQGCRREGCDTSGQGALRKVINCQSTLGCQQRSLVLIASYRARVLKDSAGSVDEALKGAGTADTDERRSARRTNQSDAHLVARVRPASGADVAVRGEVVDAAG